MSLGFYQKTKWSTSCLQIKTKGFESDLIIQTVTKATSDK